MNTESRVDISRSEYPPGAQVDKAAPLSTVRRTRLAVGRVQPARHGISRAAGFTRPMSCYWAGGWRCS
jgi:hypothetical protein